MNDLISQTQNIEGLEKKLLNLPQVPCDVVHKFGPGVYMREVFLPKGSIVIGHHQNFEHINIFIKGRITFFKDGAPVELVAPQTFVAPPGRKIAFIHEDSVWMNVYPTSETNIEKLENHYLTKSESWKNDLKEQEKVQLLSNDVDRKDFLLAISDFGLTEEYVRKISINTDDLTEMPHGNYKIKTGRSSIEGTGLFATANMNYGEVICPARINGKRTIAGRYSNHSVSPNAKMMNIYDDFYLVATKQISGCNGGHDGEEITIDYREALKLNLKLGESKCQQ